MKRRLLVLLPLLGALFLIPRAQPGFSLRVVPPPYTGMAPFVLKEDTRVPAGSRVELRLSGVKLAPRLNLQSAEEIAPDVWALDLALESGTLHLTSFLARLGSFDITTVEDQAPVVRVEKAIGDPLGFTQISYAASDDYGLKSLTAKIEVDGKTVEESLSAPFSGTGFIDLSATEHAGKPAVMKLVAQDYAGHEVVSAPISFTLPERVFSNPLAEQIIEDRKKLSPRDAGKIQILAEMAALDEEAPAAYLALLSASERLEEPETARDLLWNAALRIEEGNAASARRELSTQLQKLGSDLTNKALPAADLRQRVGETQLVLIRYLKTLSSEMQRRAGRGESAPALPPEIAQKFAISVDIRRILQQMTVLTQIGAREPLLKMVGNLKRAADTLDLNRFDQLRARQLPAMEALVDLIQATHVQESLMDRTAPKEQEGLRTALDTITKELKTAGYTPPDSFTAAAAAMQSGDKKEALKQLQQSQEAVIARLSEEVRQLALSFGLDPVEAEKTKQTVR